MTNGVSAKNYFAELELRRPFKLLTQSRKKCRTVIGLMTGHNLLACELNGHY